MSGTGGFALPQPYSPPGGGQISPGAITYTTSQDRDGRIVYHPFKAVAASYQTPQGVVHGIQWVPAEATQILPAGAVPANAEFAASWNRGQLSRDEEKQIKQWQKEEERRRKKEEKVSQRQRDHQREIQDLELQLARQKDALAREKRRSINFDRPASPSGYGAAPGTAAYGQYTRSPNLGGGELDRQFRDLEIEGRNKRYSVGDDKNRRLSGNFGGGIYGASAGGTPGAGIYGSPVGGGAYPSNTGYPPASATSPYRQSSGFPSSPNARHAELSGYPPSDPVGVRAPSPYNLARGPSPYAPPAGGVRAPSPQPPRAPSPYAPPPRAPSPYAIPAPRAPSPYNVPPRAASPYAPPPRAPSPYAPPRAPSPYSMPPPGSTGTPYSPPSRAASPYRAPSPYLPAGGGTQVYPRGHVLEGQPFARTMSPMPTPSVPGGAYPSSPRVPTATAAEQQQLAAPDCFSRTPNAAQSYTPFSMMKIQDMEAFYDQIPRMPLVLETHDVYHEDWIRFMNDLALGWAGRMPIPQAQQGGAPARRSTLIADLIDLWNNSFFLHRRIEILLYKGRERRSGPHAGIVDNHLPHYDSDDSLDSSSSSSDSDSESEEDRYPTYGHDLTESARRRREKEEKKRRKKEKKAKKKAKEREKRYTLYITYVPPRTGTAPAGGFYA